MNIRYIGPHDGVEVEGVGIVKRGETISVASAIAGRPPHAKVHEIQQALRPVVGKDSQAVAALREELRQTDPGEGLLAQPSNWEIVTNTKETKP